MDQKTEEFIKGWKEIKKQEWIGKQKARGIDVKPEELMQLEAAGELLPFEKEMLDGHKDIMKRIEDVVDNRTMLDNLPSRAGDDFLGGFGKELDSKYKEHPREIERTQRMKTREKDREKLFRKMAGEWEEREELREKDRQRERDREAERAKRKTKLIEEDVQYDSAEEKKRKKKNPKGWARAREERRKAREAEREDDEMQRRKEEEEARIEQERIREIEEREAERRRREDEVRNRPKNEFIHMEEEDPAASTPALRYGAPRRDKQPKPQPTVEPELPDRTKIEAEERQATSSHAPKPDEEVDMFAEDDEEPAKGRQGRKEGEPSPEEPHFRIGARAVGDSAFGERARAEDEGDGVFSTKHRPLTKLDPGTLEAVRQLKQGEKGDEEERRKRIDYKEVANDNRKMETLAKMKALYARMPTRKGDIYAYSLDWEVLQANGVVEKMRDFVAKKVKEYLGVEENALIVFVIKCLNNRESASTIEKKLSTILDDVTEKFVIALWKALIFEELKAKDGLIS